MNINYDFVKAIQLIGCEPKVYGQYINNRKRRMRGGKYMTREELRNYIETQRSLNNLPYHVYTTLIDGIDTLEQEPRVHAKILIKPNPRDEYDTYHYCSNCNEVLPIHYDKLNYCPNCGADMREVKE